jgi:hypothetical protein
MAYCRNDCLRVHCSWTHEFVSISLVQKRLSYEKRLSLSVFFYGLLNCFQFVTAETIVFECIVPGLVSLFPFRYCRNVCLRVYCSWPLEFVSSSLPRKRLPSECIMPDLLNCILKYNFQDLPLNRFWYHLFPIFNICKDLQEKALWIEAISTVCYFWRQSSGTCIWLIFQYSSLQH